MKKIFAVVGLIMALSIATFGFSPGATVGMDYDLGVASLNTFAGIKVGNDGHNFKLNVWTKDLLTPKDRFLSIDSEYFIGYVQSDSGALVAGISAGLNVDFTSYTTWGIDPPGSAPIPGAEIATMDFFVKGEVFDLIPELWPVFGFYGQLDITSTPTPLAFGGKLGGTIKFPW